MMLDKSKKSVQIFQPTRILTAHNAIDLRDWAKDIVLQRGSILIVDFSHVSFMDSSGLGALVSINQLVKQAGCELRICALHGQARMLLEMTNLDNWFYIYPEDVSVQDALFSAAA